MIRSERSHLRVVALTHSGAAGKNNEDRYAVTAYRLGVNDITPSLLAVVSDGVGGHRAGEIAAELAVNSISHVIAQSDASQPLETLEQAIHSASRAILAHSQTNPAQEGMAATCACTWIIGERLYTAHIGDSRIYLLRTGRVQCLTTDHTWVQEAMDRGALTQKQVQGHPNIHVIRRYLGSPQPPVVDFGLRLHPEDSDDQAQANQGLSLQTGDVILVCTDGLTDLVSDAEISATLLGNDLQPAAQALIELANARGGFDNITVILMALPQAGKKTRKRRVWSWLVAGIAGLALVAAVIVGLVRTLLRSPVDVAATSLPIVAPFFTHDPAFATPLATPDVVETPLPGAQADSAPTYTPWPTNTP